MVRQLLHDETPTPAEVGALVGEALGPRDHAEWREIDRR